MGSEFSEEKFKDCLTNKDIDEVNLKVDSVLVYVIGGGSFHEYQTVMKLRNSLNKQIIYGCDYLYSPTEFVGELREIHKNNEF